MMRKCLLKLSLLLVVIIPVLLLSAGSGGADEDNGRNGRSVSLLTTIPIPGLVVFDISWVDAGTQLYYLADRSNAAIEVIDAKRDLFVRQIKPAGAQAFKGFTGSNDTSGPNGVVVSPDGRWLFVTDANSRVVSIDLTTDQIVGDVHTGGADGLRTDELAYDPRDGILLAVNNADDPPFATLITVNKQNGHLTVGPRITFDTAHGVDATNGAEQPVWDPGTGKFYVSIPEVNCPGGHNTPPAPPCVGGFHEGAVVRIDPQSSGAVETPLFSVDFCQPAGLTLGPHQDLLVGCSVVFDTIGHAWSPSDTNPAVPVQVVLDAKTGAIDKRVAGVGGSDEVWFNSGDRRYYTASRADPLGPVLGVIDAENQRLIQRVPTFNTPSTSPAPRGTAHSVAVNPHNNHVFVPLPANKIPTSICTNGCVAVFGPPDDD